MQAAVQAGTVVLLMILAARRLLVKKMTPHRTELISRPQDVNMAQMRRLSHDDEGRSELTLILNSPQNQHMMMIIAESSDCQSCDPGETQHTT